MVSTSDSSRVRGAHSEPAPAQVSGRTWLATAVVLLAAFMELMDITMANVAIPSILADLGATSSQVQWVVAGYACSFAVGLLTGGRLGDIYGRRRVFLVGLVAFMITSAMCGFAQTAEFLVLSRVLQGLAAAVMLPQVLASLSVWFPAEKREAAFGLYGAVSGIGGVAAPLIAGALINGNLFDLGWRPIFLINLPIGLVTLVGALVLMKESTAPHRLRLDPLGMLVGALGVFLIVFPVIQGEEHGWPAWVWIMLALAVPTFAVFVAVERRKTRRDGSPLVDLSLFRQRSFAAGLVVALVFFVGVTSLAFVLMIFLQNGYDYTALRAGLALVPLAVGMVLGSGVSIGLSKKIGRNVLVIGSLLAVLSVLWLSYVIRNAGDTLGSWELVPPLAAVGIALGLVVAPLNDLALVGIPHQSIGSASGLIATMIQVGNGVGVAILGVIFFELLDGGRSFAASAGWTLYFNAAAFVLTGLLAFLIPRARAGGARAAAH